MSLCLFHSNKFVGFVLFGFIFIFLILLFMGQYLTEMSIKEQNKTDIINFSYVDKGEFHIHSCVCVCVCCVCILFIHTYSK